MSQSQTNWIGAYEKFSPWKKSFSPNRSWKQHGLQSEGKGIKDSGGGGGGGGDDDDAGVEGGSDYDDNGDDEVGGWSVCLWGIARHIISLMILEKLLAFLHQEAVTLKLLISGDLKGLVRN